MSRTTNFSKGVSEYNLEDIKAEYEVAKKIRPRGKKLRHSQTHINYVANLRHLIRRFEVSEFQKAFNLKQEAINHEEKISPQELSRQAQIRKQSFSVQEGLGLLVPESVGREAIQEGMF